MTALYSLYSRAEMWGDLERDLAAGILSEKFLYTSTESVSAWMRLCQSSAYNNYRQSLELLRGGLEQVWGTLADCSWKGGMKLNLISLGPGDGSKDELVVNFFRDRFVISSLALFDVSRPFLQLASQRVRGLVRSVLCFEGDCCRSDHLREVFSHVPEPRFIYVLGSTLGGWKPAEILPQLGSHCAPGDILMMDGEFVHPQMIENYDNRDNREFVASMLRGLGLDVKRGKLVFDLKKDSDGFSYVHKSFIPEDEMWVTMEGSGRVCLMGGRPIELSRAYKFERTSLDSLLKRAPRMRLIRRVENSTRTWFLAVLKSTESPINGMN